MITFFTLPIEFLCHDHESILSFITSTRPFFNCSIVPALISDSRKCWSRDLYPDGWTFWETFIKEDTDLNWYLLLASYCHTLQFSSSMFMPNDCNSIIFAHKVLYPAIRFQPYFSRTLKHFRSSGDNLMCFVNLLREVRSLESVTLDKTCSSDSVDQLKFLPLKKLTLENLEHDNDEILMELAASDSVIKNTLQEFCCNGYIMSMNFVSSLQNLRRLELVGDSIEIDPLGSLVNLQSLSLQFNSLLLNKKSKFTSIEDCLAQLVELRSLTILHRHRARYTKHFDSFNFLDSMLHLQYLEIEVTHLQLAHVEDPDDLDSIWRELNYVENLSQLRCVKFPYWTVDDDDDGSVCDMFFDCFGKLELLEEIMFSYPTISSNAIASIQKVASSLRKISFNMIEFIGDAGFFELISLCSNLEDLTFRQYNLDPECEKKLENVPSRLKRLDITRLWNINENFCREFLAKLENLEYLNLDSCQFLFAGWMEFLVPLHQLQSLNCSRTFLRRDISQQYTKKNFWKYEEVFLKDATFVGLRELNISRVDAIDDETLEIIVSQFPLLRVLSMEAPYQSSKITLSGVIKHLPKLTHLEELDVRGAFDAFEQVKESKSLRVHFRKDLVFHVWN